MPRRTAAIPGSRPALAYAPHSGTIRPLSYSSPSRPLMTVSRDNSLAIYRGIKATGVRFLTALPETWLVYLLQLADDDAEMTLVEVAKEEEAVGIAAGAY